MCVLRTGDSRLRHGSNERDRSSSTERSSPVMLSEAKHLAADCDRPFAEFTLERSEGLRVTWCDCTNYQGLFFTIEPCLKRKRSTIENKKVGRPESSGRPHEKHSASVSYCWRWSSRPRRRRLTRTISGRWSAA